MKYLVIILILLGGCKSSNYTQAPKNQNEFILLNEKPHKLKRPIKLIFWYTTMGVFAYVYVTTIKNR